jgi:hypothetical protein
MCEITNVTAQAVSETTIVVRGELSGECKEIKVALSWPGLSQAVESPAVVVPDHPPGVPVEWSTSFDVASGVVSSLCKEAKLRVTVRCLSPADGCTFDAGDLALECCPKLRIVEVGWRDSGDCVVGLGGILYRPIKVRVEVDWPDGFQQEAALRVRAAAPLYPDQPVERTIAASPAQSVYSDADFDPPPFLRVPPDTDYEITVALTTPQRCEQEVGPELLGALPCVCPATPSPDELLTVTELDGTAVADPTNSGCVEGDRADIIADPAIVAEWGGVSWSAATGGAVQPVEVIPPAAPGDPLHRVRVDVPLNGAALLVTATLGNAPCDWPVTTRVQRCGVEPPEPTEPEEPEEPGEPEEPEEPTEPEEPEEPEQPDVPTISPIDCCWIWFWANIGLFVGTAIMSLITFCLIEADVWAAIAALLSGGTLGAVWAALTAANVIMLILTVALIVASLVSFVLWIVICAFGHMRDIICTVLTWLMSILSVLNLVSLVVAIALTLVGRLGCAVGAWIDVGWFSTLMSITWFVGLVLGCFGGSAPTVRRRAG